MADLVSSGQVIKKQDSDAIKSAVDTALSKQKQRIPGHNSLLLPAGAGRDYTDLKTPLIRHMIRWLLGQLEICRFRRLG